MPAKTISQQKLFGMALAQKRGKAKGASKKVKELAKGMSEKKLKEFASTKHKGLKESFVLSFAQFVNESEHELGRAHVTPEGELKDLEFSQDERLEIESYQDLQRIRDFFEEAGGEGVEYNIADALVVFNFKYGGENMLILLNLDDSHARLVNVSTKTEIYSGSSNSLFDLISAKGFEFIKYGQ